MTRFIPIIGLLALVAACAAEPVAPQPERPECAIPDEKPIDGGLGGTGQAPERPEDCPPLA